MYITGKLISLHWITEPNGSSKEKIEKNLKSTVNKINVNKWSERMGGWKISETRQEESENI